MPLFEQLALNAVKALLIRASTYNRSSNLTDAWKEGPRLDSLSAHVDTSLISGRAKLLTGDADVEMKPSLSSILHTPCLPLYDPTAPMPAIVARFTGALITLDRMGRRYSPLASPHYAAFSAHIPPTFSRWVTSPTTVTNDDLRARIRAVHYHPSCPLRPPAPRPFWAPAAAAAYPPPPTSHTASADLAHAGQNLRPPPRNSHLLLRPLCHSADAVCRTPSATTSPLPPPISEPVVRSSAGCPASACTLSTPSPRPRDAFVCPCVAPPSLADVTLLQLTLTVDDDSAAAARALPAPARVIIASPPSLATSHRLAHAALLRYT
ncbi:hypothetical protein B0H14DRAFT_3424679 [Mycena olivaceomarginata]|nr:hypothetical protein B0H14DRAFT_3424679 [Mycena olivaceomarginata]